MFKDKVNDVPTYVLFVTLLLFIGFTFLVGFILYLVGKFLWSVFL